MEGSWAAIKGSPLSVELLIFLSSIGFTNTSYAAMKSVQRGARIGPCALPLGSSARSRRDRSTQAGTACRWSRSQSFLSSKESFPTKASIPEHFKRGDSASCENSCASISRSCGPRSLRPARENRRRRTPAASERSRDGTAFPIRSGRLTGEEQRIRYRSC
jgi:hypothetical protein